MSYIEDNLLPDEKIVRPGSLHWIVFAPTIFWAVIGILAFILMPGFEIFGAVIILIAVAAWIEAMVSFMTSEYAVTNRRILSKVGFIRRQTVDMFLEKVEGIRVSQPILGRIFGYGTVIVIGTGGTRDSMNRISNPLEFRRTAQLQIERIMEKTNHD